MLKEEQNVCVLAVNLGADRLIPLPPISKRRYSKCQYKRGNSKEGARLARPSYQRESGSGHGRELRRQCPQGLRILCVPTNLNQADTAKFMLLMNNMCITYKALKHYLQE